MESRAVVDSAEKLDLTCACAPVGTANGYRSAEVAGVRVGCASKKNWRADRVVLKKLLTLARAQVTKRRMQVVVVGTVHHAGKVQVLIPLLCEGTDAGKTRTVREHR